MVGGWTSPATGGRDPLALAAAVAVGAAGSLLLRRFLFPPAAGKALSTRYKSSSSKRVLLISNSKLFGMGYLDHCEGHIQSFLSQQLSSYILFVPCE